MKVLLIGGDKRSEYAERKFREAGFETDTLGLHINDKGDIQKADIIVLPVPTTRDGVNIFCPLTKKVISLKELDNVCKKTMIFSSLYGGEKENITDISELDEFSILNAVPTAEGAIAYAINSTEKTLFGSKVLVIGNGRVGKALRARLRALGAVVTVSARKPRDYAEIEINSCEYLESADLKKNLNRFDLIFNTVDAPLFCEEDLSFLKNPIIDLSTRGCTAEKNEKIIKLPGIPGKTAPQTAGEVIFKTVIGQLKLRRDIF